MRFNYQKMFHVKHLSAYEQLLVDFMKKDQTLFARQDGIEAMWGIVDPIMSKMSQNKKCLFMKQALGAPVRRISSSKRMVENGKIYKRE